MSVTELSKPRLTSEQKALVRGVLGLVDRLARYVLDKYGSHKTWNLSREDAHKELVAIGHSAVTTAALTYDPNHPRRVPFEDWAKYRAVEAMLQAGNAEVVQRAFAISASRAFACQRRTEPRDPFQDTPASLLEELVAACDGPVIAMLESLGDVRSPESELIAKEDMDRTKRALDEGKAKLSAEQRAMLELRFTDDLSIADVAKQRGASYWAVYREHQDALQRLQKTLAWNGIRTVE